MIGYKQTNYEPAQPKNPLLPRPTKVMVSAGIVEHRHNIDEINNLPEKLEEIDSSLSSLEEQVGNVGSYGVDETNIGVNKYLVFNGTEYELQDKPTPGDRYKTSSTSTHTIASSGNLTFVVDSGLSYTPGQDVLISYDELNSMSGTIVSYSGTSLVVHIKHKEGAGTYSNWLINLDGLPVQGATNWGTIIGDIQNQTDLINALNTKVNKSGDTMTGKLTLPAGTTASASLNIPQGVGPTAPVEGDIRNPDGSIWMRGAGVTRRMWDTNQMPTVSSSEATSGASAGVRAWSPIRVWDAIVARLLQTMPGKLLLASSSASAASLNIPQSTAPDTPVNGDLWHTTGGTLQYRASGTNRTIWTNSNVPEVTQVEAEQGTNFGIRVWSPFRVFQAIASFMLGTITRGNGITMNTGTGSPEGLITANPGSEFRNTLGQLWTKASGVGSTGWAINPTSVLGTEFNIPRYDANGNFVMSGMTSSANGSLGVGVTPNSRIHAVDGTVAELKFNSGFLNATPSLSVGNTSATGKFASLLAGTTGAAFFYDASGTFTISSATKTNYNDNNLGQSGTVRIGITSSGVGVATPTPRAAFEVNGLMASTSGFAIQFDSGAGSFQPNFSDQGSFLRIQSWNGLPLHINPAGNAVQIGSASQMVTIPGAITRGDSVTSRTGTSSPEGVVTASPGSEFRNTLGQLWTKVTGTGNTGWARVIDTLGGIFTGNTVSGSDSSSLVEFNQTWNTTGNPTLIRANVTNTASGASSNLMDLQVGGTSQFRVSRSGLVRALGGVELDGSFTGIFPSNRQMIVRSGLNPNEVGNDIILSNSQGDVANTSGIRSLIQAARGFNPTSGSGVYNVINIAPPINQTGTATGISRGILLNPTLTSAVDWRAIEINTGSDSIVAGRNVGRSVLDLSSTTKGFLPPRMTTAQRNAIGAVSGDAGLCIYNTTTGNYETWNGTQWISSYDIPQTITRSNSITMHSGTGNPEGVVTANPGSIFQSTDGNVYRKSTGVGSTGWVAVGGGSTSQTLRITIPGDFTANTTGYQGLYFRNTSGANWTISNVSVSVGVNASGGTPDCSVQLYKSSGTLADGINTNAVALFSSNISLGTNYESLTNVPTVTTVENGRWLSMRVISNTGTTRRAADLQLIITLS